MADNRYISLKISGNPDSHSGFMPLISFNSPSFEIRDDVYGGFNTNSYFFSVKTEANQVVYKLFKNNVSSYGAIRPGTLVIGIAIPRGYKLAGNISPWEVLVRIKDIFLTRCMTCKDPTTERYEFNQGRIDSTLFDDYAKMFDLTPYQGPYRQMHSNAPVGYVIADEFTAEALMKDVHYPAFTDFSEVFIAGEVGANNHTQIQGLSIPRIPEYSFHVDGELKDIVRNIEKECKISGDKNPRYYDNKTVNFTVKGLLDGSEIIPDGLSIDKRNESINLDSKVLYEPKKKKFRIEFSSPEARQYFLNHKEELLVSNSSGRQITLNGDLSFILRGEELAFAETPAGLKLQQIRPGKFNVKNVQFGKDGFFVVAEKKKEEQRRVIPKPDTISSSSSEFVEILVAFTPDIFNDENGSAKTRRIELFGSQNGKLKTFFSTLANFEYKEGTYRSAIYVAKTLLQKGLKLRVKSESFLLVTKNSISQWNGPQPILLSDDSFICEKKRFTDKFIKPYKLLLAVAATFLVSLILGLLLGHYVIPDNKSADKPYESVQNETDVSEGTDQSQVVPEETLPTETTEIPRSTVPCPKCGQQFESPEKAVEHIQLAHPETMPDGEHVNIDNGTGAAATTPPPATSSQKLFPCPICNNERVRFKTQGELDAHMKSKHKGDNNGTGKNNSTRTKNRGGNGEENLNLGER